MSAPRLAVLLGTQEQAEALLPALHRSRFALTHRCLDATQLREAIAADAVDVALVSTGPRGLDPTSLLDLARRPLAVVVLDPHPEHRQWTVFPGVVLLPDATPDEVVDGLDKAVHRVRWRQPAPVAPSRAEPVAAPASTEPHADPPAVGAGAAAAAAMAQVITVVGGHGAPGRSLVAGDLGFLLGLVGRTVVIDADLAAAMLAPRFRASTHKNLGTLAHAVATDGWAWPAALRRDLQRLHADCPKGWLIAGLPRPDGRDRVDGAFLDALISALRPRFAHIVIDTGVQWLDGDAAAEVPLLRADHVLVVATPDAIGVHRASLALDRLRRRGNGRPVSLVVNQHRGAHDARQDELAFRLGERISAVLPFDPTACRRALDAQRPVALDARSRLGRGLIDLAEHVQGGRIVLPHPPTQPARAHWWSPLLSPPWRAGAARPSPGGSQ